MQRHTVGLAGCGALRRAGTEALMQALWLQIVQKYKSMIQTGKVHIILRSVVARARLPPAARRAPPWRMPPAARADPPPCPASASLPTHAIHKFAFLSTVSEAPNKYLRNSAHCTYAARGVMRGLHGAEVLQQLRKVQRLDAVVGSLLPAEHRSPYCGTAVRPQHIRVNPTTSDQRTVGWVAERGRLARIRC